MGKVTGRWERARGSGYRVVQEVSALWRVVARGGVLLLVFQRRVLLRSTRTTDEAGLKPSSS